MLGSLECGKRIWWLIYSRRYSLNFITRFPFSIFLIVILFYRFNTGFAIWPGIKRRYLVKISSDSIHPIFLTPPN